MTLALRGGKVIHVLSLGILVMLVLATAVHAKAQVVLAPATPVIGSSNTISADPPVTRPDTKPCTVALFTNLEFADFNTKTTLTPRLPLAPVPGQRSSLRLTSP